MSCLAVLFALDKNEVDALMALNRRKRCEYMHREIEEKFFENSPEYLCELDKSWDAMHRMLTDGNLDFENKFLPLCNVIFGGELIYGLIRNSYGEVDLVESEDDEFMILKTPEQVAEITEALLKRTKEECRKCYNMIDEDDYGDSLSDEDFEYTWDYLQGSLEFWKRAKEEKKYVLFTVDR